MKLHNRHSRNYDHSLKLLLLIPLPSPFSKSSISLYIFLRLVLLIFIPSILTTLIIGAATFSAAGPFAMTSYLASLSTHYSSLRRLIPTSLSEDADLHVSSTEDSHLSRVLRAYYTEKGRPFPPWLGPDPHQSSKSNHPSTTPALSNTSLNSSNGSLRSGRGGKGLGDLFADVQPAGTQQTREDQLSLRSRRPGIRSPDFRGGSSDSIPYPQKVAVAPQPEPLQPNVRPLPSQRAGSYQSRQATPPSSSAGPPPGRESTMQERLKARLGARGQSPTFGGRADSGSTTPPASAGSHGSYDGESSRPGFNNNNNNNNHYASSSSASSTSKPYTGSSSPWITGEDNGSYSSNPTSAYAPDSTSSRRLPPGGGRIGLPNGPRLR